MTIRSLIAGFSLLVAGAATGHLAANAPAGDLEDLLAPGGRLAARADIHGRALGPGSLDDRLAVVAFVSADCSILCVTRTMDLDRLARDLPGSLRGRVAFLAVGTDPAAGPARLRAFADDLLGPAPALRFLAPDAAGVRAILERLRYPAASLPEPPPTILLFDRRGRIAMTYGCDPLDAPRLASDLSALDTFTQGLGRPPAAVPDPARPSL
jgi:cytochrome oxidase Cu insertion factor (SCO1/SenC/PrrC family)